MINGKILLVCFVALMSAVTVAAQSASDDLKPRREQGSDEIKRNYYLWDKNYIVEATLKKKKILLQPPPERILFSKEYAYPRPSVLDFVPPKKTDRLVLLTSQNHTVEYTVYGELEFTLKSHKYYIVVFESARPSESGEKLLFFPFADWTNGRETYEFGRYIHFSITGEEKKRKIALDFNKAENPPCAFNESLNCPLPPRSNRMLTKIVAGELKYK